MFQLERQQQLLKYINENKKADVDELSQMFNVSKVTIRRDINELAKQKKIIKAHGGAIQIGEILYQEVPYNQKRDSNISSKSRIGFTAAQLINDGDIIIVDSGSTTLELVKNITQKNITILTDDLIIAEVASTNTDIRTLVSGGQIIHGSYAMAGHQTANFFKCFHANKAFLGCDALDPDIGLTTRTLEEVAIKKAMMESANEIVLLTDCSKLHNIAFCQLSDLHKIDHLIIDELDDKTKSAFENMGIKVTITH